MRSLADLIQETGSEDEKEEGDPEDRLERLEPDT